MFIWLYQKCNYKLALPFKIRSYLSLFFRIEGETLFEGMFKKKTPLTEYS